MHNLRLKTQSEPHFQIFKMAAPSSLFGIAQSHTTEFSRNLVFGRERDIFTRL